MRSATSSAASHSSLYGVSNIVCRLLNCGPVMFQWKTHSFHWNITGPQFNSLHTMFETPYNELWLAADEVAERIRTLDVFAPGSYSQFGKLTSIKEEPGVPEWKDMVGQLVEGHEIAAHTARQTIKAADAAGD